MNLNKVKEIKYNSRSIKELSHMGQVIWSGKKPIILTLTEDDNEGRRASRIEFNFDNLNLEGTYNLTILDFTDQGYTSIIAYNTKPEDNNTYNNTHFHNGIIKNHVIDPGHTLNIRIGYRSRHPNKFKLVLKIEEV